MHGESWRAVLKYVQVFISVTFTIMRPQNFYLWAFKKNKKRLLVVIFLFMKLKWRLRFIPFSKQTMGSVLKTEFSPFFITKTYIQGPFNSISCIPRARNRASKPEMGLFYFEINVLIKTKKKNVLTMFFFFSGITTFFIGTSITKNVKVKYGYIFKL